MKNIRVLGIVIIVILISLSACTAISTTPSLIPATPTSKPQAQPIIPATTLVLTEKVRVDLANQLGISFDQISLFTSEPHEWSNNCLELPRENEKCSDVVTPGYKGTLLVGEMQYEFRSDATGSNVRFIPGAALAAQQVLAAQLGLLPEEVKIIRTEKVDWPDACLGVTSAGQICAQVITPGFRITLEANGKRYEYHTDTTGSAVRLALAPTTTLSQTVLSWEGRINPLCEKISVSQTMLVFGECEGAQVSLPFQSADRRMDLEYFLKQYAPFDSETTAGKIKFAGQGSVTATQTEQRMLAEWARRLVVEVQALPPSGYSPVAFAWHREGGIAGFCDDVIVYLDGSAEVSSCKSPQPQSLNRIRLTANQMMKIFNWVDTYQTLDILSGDKATADGMITHLVFNGQGDQAASAEVQSAISAIASEIVLQTNQITDPAELLKAKTVLESYFKALQSKKYIDAASMYGGDYEILVNNNPDVNASDYPALFEKACTQNGFVCDITIKNIVHVVQLGAGEFRFTVEFQNSDGTLFILEPCCGSDISEFPPLTQFDFVVKNIDGNYKVMDLPVYVP
ncbi:MAG: hypothetical protein ACPL0B_00510 [Anaerolineales bacterium]